MSLFIGIDTSNYTTSVSAFDGSEMIYRKKLLPVKKGERGIRQSDAVFHHTAQIPELFEDMLREVQGEISAVGVSDRPSNQNGSYMPCFSAGVCVARSIAAALNVPLYKFSHQDGHIAAAIYSSGQFNLLNQKFLAFHVSGGTSQGVLVTPGNNYFTTEVLSDSLDLKAGQAIDRVGISLGLDFPCGAQLDLLARKSEADFSKIKIYSKEASFSLSGIENKCNKMLIDGEKYEDIALFCIKSIETAISDSCDYLLTELGTIPVLFSGGVMSNSIIRSDFTEKYNAAFAEPALSSDNACGIAFLTNLLFSKEIEII